jgi:hypothetical protein
MIRLFQHKIYDWAISTGVYDQFFTVTNESSQNNAEFEVLTVMRV